jgi:hypothetical protein
LFYDAAGVGEFYTTNGQGGISQIGQHTNWRSSWSQIIPGDFAQESVCVRLHFKSLLPIDDAITRFIDTQFIAMQQLFATKGINVSQETTEDLSGDPNLQDLQDLDVGQCFMGQTTQDQNTLFANRNNAGNKELVIYIVATLIGGTGNFLGCAAHPDEQPGAVVVQTTDAWLTAHEVGHVLGLRHVCEFPTTTNPTPETACVSGGAQRDNLMFPNVGWTNVPPDLSAAEESTMRDSSLTNSC